MKRGLFCKACMGGLLDGTTKKGKPQIGGRGPKKTGILEMGKDEFAPTTRGRGDGRGYPSGLKEKG